MTEQQPANQMCCSGETSHLPAGVSSSGFEMKEHHAVIVDRDHCMECGACEKTPVEAVHIRAGVGCAYEVIVGILKRTTAACGWNH